MASGLGFWFTSPDMPGWKMVLTVVCGLFPILCVLQLAVMPFLDGQPVVLKMLLGAFMSVSLLQWVVMPPLRKVLRWWHHPTQASTAIDITGAVAIFAFLVLCAVLFRLYLG